MKTFTPYLLGSFLLTLAVVHGQTTPTTVTTTTAPTSMSAKDAVHVAMDGVDPSLRDRIVSVYGVGTSEAIQTWWVIFYDPSVDSHGRAVKVENGQVARTYEAKGGVVYGDTLTFAGSQVTGERKAVAAAQDYAAQHALAYDHIRVLLRITAQGQDFRWRVQLLNGAVSKGFVFVNASDGSFAMYAPPGSVPVKESSGTGGGVVGDVNRAANNVKSTFLGIGGDLQEFFTGERNGRSIEGSIFMKIDLIGKRVAILATDGFEQSELLEPRAALEAAGATTTVVSPEEGEITAWAEDDWGDTVEVDTKLSNANADDFDALLLPGGVQNPDTLRTLPAAVQFVRDFFAARKPVAAICHGPQLLIEAEAVKHRTVTSFPSIKTDLINAGAYWVDQAVVVDDGLVTSRRPSDIPKFNEKMIQQFARGMRQKNAA